MHRTDLVAVTVLFPCKGALPAPGGSVVASQESVDSESAGLGLTPAPSFRVTLWAGGVSPSNLSFLPGALSGSL